MKREEYEYEMADFAIAAVIVLCFVGIFTIFNGCSLNYKPDVHDSTINHQSDNTIKPSTDVNLDFGGKK